MAVLQCPKTHIVCDGTGKRENRLETLNETKSSGIAARLRGVARINQVRVRILSRERNVT